MEAAIAVVTNLGRLVDVSSVVEELRLPKIEIPLTKVAQSVKCRLLQKGQHLPFHMYHQIWTGCSQTVIAYNKADRKSVV